MVEKRQRGMNPKTQKEREGKRREVIEIERVRERATHKARIKQS